MQLIHLELEKLHKKADRKQKDCLIELELIKCLKIMINNVVSVQRLVNGLCVSQVTIFLRPAKVWYPRSLGRLTIHRWNYSFLAITLCTNSTHRMRRLNFPVLLRYTQRAFHGVAWYGSPKESQERDRAFRYVARCIRKDSGCAWKDGVLGRR